MYFAHWTFVLNCHDLQSQGGVLWLSGLLGST